ncbi:hypothetical protein [Cytobacillus horneckiae]|uniref:Uncharacterized protein n=1 Tax=Cytobacillus horneckiae TaxID=549687 RepID=A0A2N0ZF99_9BACI|nr:hypothetical protein [Cytobacillus horneckiae]MEC1155630.1 hypothetical protein [Cytobacillus horneckiae]PKG28184.1 hypothetical protein CWS20_15180 [Cytobacillus horneckiae]
MNFTKKDLFFCYDALLHRKIADKNIEFVTSAISNSNRRFWLYIRTPLVNQIIDEYFKRE